MRVIDNPSATTDRHTSRVGTGTFFISTGWIPVSLHEGWRGFCIVVIFFQTETSSGLLILKISGISSMWVLAPFMRYLIKVGVIDRLFNRVGMSVSTKKGKFGNKPRQVDLRLAWRGFYVKLVLCKTSTMNTSVIWCAFYLGHGAQSKHHQHRSHIFYHEHERNV